MVSIYVYKQNICIYIYTHPWIRLQDSKLQQLLEKANAGMTDFDTKMELITGKKRRAENAAPSK